MDPTTVRQLQGATDLVADTVEAAAAAIGDAHRELARRPFDLLAHVACLAPPVRLVQQVHDVVVSGVYTSICAAARGGGVLAGAALGAMSDDDRHP